MIAACGVWFAYWKASVDITEIQAPLQGLRLIARELIVEDPKQLAAVKRFKRLYDQNIIDLYLPELDGKHFELRLAMDELPVSKDFKPEKFVPLKRAILDPGKHVLEYQYDDGAEHAVLTVLVDGEKVIEEIRAKDWIKSGGSSSQSSVESLSKSFESDEIVQVIHLRFMTEEKPKGTFSTPKTPCPGISLWIEAIDSVPDGR